ncbi:MAG: sulfur carrier protein ThiS [Micromonosporaceae bacterium]
MNVSVNGQARQFTAEATVADAVTALTAAPNGVAVAVNGEVVPRGEWRTTALRDGDQLEVLTASQGG